MITFRAHCARGHDRVDYTDPAAFEAHMTGEHGAKKRRMGGHPYPAESGPVAPGWGPNGPLPAHPHRAPRGSESSSSPAPASSRP